VFEELVSSRDEEVRELCLKEGIHCLDAVRAVDVRPEDRVSSEVPFECGTDGLERQRPYDALNVSQGLGNAELFVSGIHETETLLDGWEDRDNSFSELFRRDLQRGEFLWASLHEGCGQCLECVIGACWKSTKAGEVCVDGGDEGGFWVGECKGG